MTELLAIVDDQHCDDDLLDEISHHHPSRVTILLEHSGSEGAVDDQTVGDRLAWLLAAVERETGATVVGLAGSREQLEGWRFDCVVTARRPAAV